MRIVSSALWIKEIHAILLILYTHSFVFVLLYCILTLVVLVLVMELLSLRILPVINHGYGDDALFILTIALEIGKCSATASPAIRIR
jgi:hypothetical protein